EVVGEAAVSCSVLRAGGGMPRAPRGRAEGDGAQSEEAHGADPDAKRGPIEAAAGRRGGARRRVRGRRLRVETDPWHGRGGDVRLDTARASGRRLLVGIG